MSFFERFKRVLKDQRGFGLAEVALPALAEGFADITVADVATGALIGGGISGIEGGNILTGALEGGVGGAFGDIIEGSGVLSGVGDALGNAADSVENFFGFGGQAADGLSDAAGDAITSSSAAGGTPTSAIGASGSTATGAVTSPSNISGLTDTNISSALNNTSDASGALSGGSGSSFGSISGTSGTGAASTASNFSGVSGSDLGGFSNAPNVGGISGSVPSGVSKGIESAAGDGFEAGGGFNYDSALNSSIPSSNASSASLFSSGPSLEAGGGITASTGVKPVSDSLLSQAGDFLGKVPAKALAPAASLAYQALSGPPKLPSAEQALLKQDQTLAQNQLNEYNTGVLQPGQQAQLDTSKQNAINQLYQQFASMGVTNPQSDTRFQQGLAQIEAQIQSQKQGFLDSSLTAANGAGGQIENIAKDQMAQDKSYSDEVSAASEALFSLLGSGG